MLASIPDYPPVMFHNYSLNKRAVPMSQVAALVGVLGRQGIGSAEVLRGTGLCEADIGDPEGRVSYRQRIRQLQNVVELVPAGSWLDWRDEVSISDYGLLGYAMMSSATLGKAVQIAVKYHKMAGAMFELIFVLDDSDAVLRLDHLLAGGLVGQYVVEDVFSGVTPLIRLLTGRPFSPKVIHFNHARPDYVARYPEQFDCRIEFNQKFSEYRFDASLLQQPLAEADANTARICEESCRKLLNQMEIEEDMISRICHMLLSTPGDFPRLEVIACRLSMGTRTLRRRLKSLGTSYQKILDDVKRELAIEYLQTTNLSIQEISDLLGYSEVTNFRRAFVKWAEMSPYQYRKQIEA